MYIHLNNIVLGLFLLVLIGTQVTAIWLPLVAIGLAILYPPTSRIMEKPDDS